MKKERFITERIYTLILTLSVPVIAVVFFRLLFWGSAGTTPYARQVFWLENGAMVLTFILAAAVLGVMSIVKAFRTFNKSYEDCVRGMLINKTGLIVFFSLNLMWDVMLSMMFIMGSRGLLLIFMPPVWAVMSYFTWLALIPGAIWGIQVARACVKEKGMSKPQAVLHSILQFVFMVDVLDCLYLAAVKWGMGKKRAVVILVLYAVLIIAAVICGIKIFTAFQALGS